MTEELKPCPFCGGAAELETGKEHIFAIPICGDCGACIPAQFGEDRATQAWNSRHVVSYVWLKHDGPAWECPNCHAVFELEGGTPEDKYLNYCPVCGVKLEVAE